MTRDTRCEARTQGASICRHIGATEGAASRRVAPVRRPGSFSGQAPNRPEAVASTQRAMRSLVVGVLLALALFTGAASAGRLQVSTVTVGAGPAVVAADPTRNLVFVTSVRSNTIGVLDGSTRAVLATIDRPPGGR